MSYSRRQLYAMGEPLGDGATRREVGGKIIYGTGGGGSSAPEKQTTVVDIPSWAQPYAKESLGKAAALTSTPYQAYGGERIAQFNPLQKQAFEQAGQQQVAGQVGLGSGLAALSGISSFQDPGTAQGFMSPYMQNVVDQQMESAQRQADIAATQRGASAVRAGAFGGSRQAIENAEANRALASQKGQIQATGLQSAYERAQSQFNAEQANRLASAQALGQLGQQQFGQQMDITGQQATFGGQQRQATQDILSQQYQDFQNQQRAPYDQLAFMSSIIRGTPMGQTTTMYQPPANPTSQLIGLGTAAAGAYGAYQGAQPRAAAGGEVKGYAAGGGIGIGALLDNVGSLSDDQLSQMQQTEQGPLTLAVVAEELLNRQAAQNGAAQQQATATPLPQTTVVENEFEQLAGLPGLPASNLDGMGTATMADGGIVAFQGGGTAYNPYEYGYTPLSAERQAEISQRAVAPTFTSTEVNIVDRARFKQMNGLPLTAEETAALKAPAPTAAPTAAAAPASNAPRVGLRKGMDDPRVGLAGLTPAKAKAEQAAAAKAQPAAEKPAPTGAGAGVAPAGLSALKAQTASGMNALKGQMEDINKARTDAAQAAVERAKAQEAEMGEYGVEEGKRLKAREEGLKGAEDKNFNMALIEAGLAMMSGTSANAFENIGKGAMVGTKAYTTGIERIQSRKEKLDDALIALENAKRSDKRVSQERMDRLQANVDNAKTANAEAIYKFGKDRLDMTREDARFATEIASRERIASIGAAGRSEDKPFNYQAAYQNYLNNNLGKKDAFNKDIPVLSYADYVRKYALKTTDDSSGRRVRQLPE